MMTKEVNDWLRKVENGNYSSWEIMEEFTNFNKYLTKEEVEQIKNRLKNSIRR